ncbi:MAG: endonuclease MutS2, partial [Chloroflexota bacterium]|nr:endonuclease MutS2 [Chloroflexota bacterium]
LSQLEGMLHSKELSRYLQEPIITQRDGRYVIPVRADSKNQVDGIVHDQSASGATLYIEPLKIVPKNNKYRQLQLSERDEERRVLLELTAQVGEHELALREMLEALANIDLAFARARYAEILDASEPKLNPIRALDKDESKHPLQGRIRLFDARHPLLDAAKITLPGVDEVVPIDVELFPKNRALVITGPNTGGKTVILKTVGLLALMAQSGLHIPAHPKSEISLFKKIFADIGDEQSIEQSLSTFSGHITNIISILEQADEFSLVILDELGAGTDPQEGAALARSLLVHLMERGITTLVTTHHPELKAFAHSMEGVVNASVEFDLETLRPTYHLTIGLPGRSNALAIAERLGLPDEIIATARQEIDPTDLKADDLLDEIYRQRDRARKARQRADETKQDATQIRLELAERLDHIEDERRSVLEEARLEAEADVAAVRDQIQELQKNLRQARQPLDIIQQAEEKVEELAVEVEAPVERHIPESIITPLQGPIQLGSKVHVRSLGQAGVVLTLGEDEAEVQVGILRVRARLSELVLSGRGEEAPVDNEQAATDVKSPRSLVEAKHPSPGVELDLRGQRSDEALSSLEHYLDKAYLARLPWVRIIHGKGTGKLRRVVREAFNEHPQIKSFQAGKRAEGGDGVTVAELRD